MKTESFLNKIRLLVGDIEGLGYSDELLIEFINDGLCLIHSMRPDWFVESLVVEAQVGAVQKLPACCAKLFSVDAVCDACGYPLDLLLQNSVKMARAFNKKPMREAHARSFFIRDSVPDAFEVHPPVLPDEELFFRVTVSVLPDAVTSLNDELPECKMQEALLHYVLYRVYSVETESVTSVNLAESHYSKLFAYLGVERASDREVLEDNATSLPV